MSGKNLSELCRRYNQKQNTMSMFISKYRNEIDPDGTHIIRSGRNVYFDNFAVAKIDELRNFTPEIMLPEETQHNDEYQKLREENERLKIEKENLKDEVISLLQEIRKKEVLLAEEQKKTALLTAGGNQYIAEIERIEKEKEELKDENVRLRSRPVSVDRRAGSRWRWGR